MDDMTGNTVKAAVFERMRQAVGRLVRDGAQIDGEIVLTVRDGQLVDVRLPGGKPAKADEEDVTAGDVSAFVKPRKPKA